MGKFTHPYFSTPRELHFLVVSENFTRSKRIRHEKCMVLARPKEILFLGLAKTQGNFFPRSWQDPGKEFPWVLVKIFLILTFFDKMSGISPRVILLISLSSLPGNGFFQVFSGQGLKDPPIFGSGWVHSLS